MRRDWDPALSPDGARVAVSRFDPATSTRNIWILDAQNGAASAFTSHLCWATCPLRSPDSARIVFASGRERGAQVFEQRVGTSDTLTPSEPANGCPSDWSPDGRLLFGQDRRPLQKDGKDAEQNSAKVETEVWARFAPNGRWVASVSAVSGRREVYVRSVDRSDARRWQISQGGGAEPQWRADGKELFFIGADRRFMAVPVDIDETFHAGVASSLFSTELDPNGLGISGRNQYVPMPSGERFLINQPRPGATSPPITVVVNWMESLRESSAPQQRAAR